MVIMPIENVSQTIDNCRYCLMCRHIAPVEFVTHRETLSPHGWALVIASIRRGLMEWNDDTMDVLYSAADSGNSRAHCVTDQPLPEAIAAVRAEVVAQDLAPASVYKINESINQWGTPFAQMAPQTSIGKGSYALFVGDEAKYLWPDTLDAALNLLKAVDIEPVLIGIGRNNGYLPSSLGFPETARELAFTTLTELENCEADHMLVLSPGDYFTFKQLYDERLGIEWPATVQLGEVTILLSEQLESGKLKLHKTNYRSAFAYIDPTHAVRVPTRHEAPRKLLSAVMPTEGRELFWRRERAHPVGSTALQFTKPDIAEKLTAARLEDALQSGAEWVITEDAATLSHLKKMADKYNVRVKGLYELLAEQLIF